MTLLGYSVPETLTDDDGNVRGGFTLTVTGPEGYSGTVVTDVTTGIFRLGPLPIGDYTVTYGARSATVPVLAQADDVQDAVDLAAGAETPAGAQAKADAAQAAAEAAAAAALDASEEAARGTYAAKAVMDPPRLAFLFDGPDSDVGIFREDSSTTVDDYFFAKHVGDGRYWCTQLREGTIGGLTIHSLGLAEARRLMVNTHHTEAALVKTGTFATTSNTASYGGSYTRSAVTGDFATFTSQAGATRVGWRGPLFTNGGIVKVEIDGSATAATLLPTAQELVTSGALDSTALVANGGTLNPTDRVHDLYSATSKPNSLRVYATGLAPGVHTVKWTVTGYKNPGSADVRLYIAGQMAYAAEAMGGTVIPTYTDAALTGTDSGSTEVLEKSSVYEYALQPRPSGAATSGWVGNDHGFDTETGLTFKVNGTITTPANNTAYTGEVVVTRTSELRHADLGSTKIADVTVTYTLNGRGLRVRMRITWAVSGVMEGNSYPAMFPLGSHFTAGNVIGSGLADATLTANDGAQRNSTDEAAGAYLWGANYGALMVLTEGVVPGSRMFIEDRLGGVLNKVYYLRTTSETFTAGDVWTTEMLLSVRRFSNPAALLAA